MSYFKFYCRARSLRLEDLEVYKVAMEIGQIVWRVVMKWGYFEKKTLGAQFVDAADSIAFSVSEGYGRFHFKENKNFCIIAGVLPKKRLLLPLKPETGR